VTQMSRCYHCIFRARHVCGVFRPLLQELQNVPQLCGGCGRFRTMMAVMIMLTTKARTTRASRGMGDAAASTWVRDGFGSSTVDYVELAAADFDALPLLVPKEQVHYRRRILHGSSPGTGCLYIHSGECLLPLSSVWKIEPVSIGFFWCILRQLWWGLSLWSAPKLSFGELLSGFTAFTPDTVATGWTHCCRSLGKQNGRPLVMEARHRRDQCREGGPRMRDTRVSFNSQDVLPGA
jgi:hypothetical protein